MFARLNHTVVVINSGLHDIAQPFDFNRMLPLSLYMNYVKLLDSLMRKALARNPTLSFVLRATTHSPAFQMRSCSIAQPNQHAEIVDRLNAMAEGVTDGTRVHYWRQPALMTYSAPKGSFRDAAHFDQCGKGAEDLNPGSRGGRCAISRMRPMNGTELRSGRNQICSGWARCGGLNEAITQTLFSLPIFDCEHASRMEMGGASAAQPTDLRHCIV